MDSDYELDLDETKEDLSPDAAAFVRLKHMIEKSIHTLTAMDAVDVGPANQRLRQIKANMVNVIRTWPYYEELQNNDVWPELTHILEELKALNSNRMHIDAVVTPTEGSKAHGTFNHGNFPPFVKHYENENVFQFPQDVSSRRRSSQINDEYLPPSASTINFQTATPSFYSCDRCLTNEHSSKFCKTPRKCLQCKKRGHIARECKFNLCVWCQLYGHAQVNCKSKQNGEPPACHRCGQKSHLAIDCTTEDARYCRLCGGHHSMTECEQFTGECYKHFGEHRFEECEEAMAKRNQS